VGPKFRLTLLLKYDWFLVTFGLFYKKIIYFILSIQVHDSMKLISDAVSSRRCVQGRRVCLLPIRTHGCTLTWLWYISTSLCKNLEWTWRLHTSASEFSNVSCTIIQWTNYAFSSLFPAKQGNLLLLSPPISIQI
jgi:hypothetical protein